MKKAKLNKILFGIAKFSMKLPRGSKNVYISSQVSIHKEFDFISTINLFLPKQMHHQPLNFFPNQTCAKII